MRIPNKYAVPAGMAILIAILAGGTSIRAKKKNPPQIWGIQMPEGAEKVQEYRNITTFLVGVGPAEAARELTTATGDPKSVQVSRSQIGATLMVFIEDRLSRQWSTIQVSGVVGGHESYVTVTRQSGEIGWRCEWQKSEKRWEYQ